MEEKLQISSEASRRYGKALYETSKEEYLEQDMYEETSRLLELLSSNNSFKKLFSSPVLSANSQEILIDNIFSVTNSKKIKVSKNLFSFLKVLASNRRLRILTDALYSFQAIIKAMNEEVNVKIISAVPLSNEAMNTIKVLFSNSTTKKINLESNVDKNIIGGIILQVGSFLIDTSIKSKILKINNAIKGVN